MVEIWLSKRGGKYETNTCDSRRIAAGGGDGWSAANTNDAPVGATIWVDDVLVAPAAASAAGRYVQSRVTVGQPGEPFSFRSPADATLDYILLYLWDRTEKTPKRRWSPMDVYREAVEGGRKGKG